MLAAAYPFESNTPPAARILGQRFCVAIRKRITSPQGRLTARRAGARAAAVSRWLRDFN